MYTLCNSGCNDRHLLNLLALEPRRTNDTVRVVIAGRGAASFGFPGVPAGTSWPRCGKVGKVGQVGQVWKWMISYGHMGISYGWWGNLWLRVVNNG